jgi:hypothetical protein
MFLLCDCGTVFEFYEMTYAEIIECIECSQERQKQQLQLQAGLIYRHAYLSGYSFNAPSDMPSIDEAFPNVFPPKEEREVQTYEQMKANLMLYAMEHNTRWEVQQGNGDSK